MSPALSGRTKTATRWSSATTSSGPACPSYDRYLKGVQQFGMTRASKTFLLDCVVDEDKDRLTSEMEEYPGVALTIAGKLTEILGLTERSKFVKKL